MSRIQKLNHIIRLLCGCDYPTFQAIYNVLSDILEQRSEDKLWKKRKKK